MLIASIDLCFCFWRNQGKHNLWIENGAENTEVVIWAGMGFPLSKLFSNLACRFSFGSLIYGLFSIPAHVRQFAYVILIAQNRVYMLLKAHILNDTVLLGLGRFHYKVTKSIWSGERYFKVCFTTSLFCPCA